MCGIFGVLNFKNDTDAEKVTLCRDVLTHRGPDDAGMYTSNDKKFIVGHRRLSIIDTSRAGHQPMTSPDGRYTIVLNGEIYNHKEILNRHPELISGAQPLRSGSDTEVLLRLFQKNGKDCLNELRGMFAFAVWDEKEKKLFAARDRFGIKPFYYLLNNNEFIFSSELKAIKLYKGNLSISSAAIDAFLKTGSVPAPLTIYEETKSLEPGYSLSIQSDGKLSPERYFSFFDLIEPGKGKPYDKSAKENLRLGLLTTIKAHMVSDVEVGAFLSGGIDSTAIVSLMRQCGQEKIKTVSVVFPGNKLDESRYARLAAKKYNTEHIEVPFYEKDLLDDFDNIIAVMDQPTIDGINTYFVSKAAKQAGLKVVLSGLGGDELFGGYPSFRNIPRYQKIKNFPLAKTFMKATAPFLQNRLPAKAIQFMKNPNIQNAEYKLIRGLFTEEELDKLGWSYPAELNDGTSAEVSTTTMQHISYLESCNYMRNQLLRDSDVFSMAHSLELRVPFVDNKLYEAVLPYLDDSYDKNFPKKMLVEATGDIPDEIVHRPKMGFTFPFADWMNNGKLKEQMVESLKSLNLKSGQHGGLNIDHSSLNTNNLHWSRFWTLFVLNSFSEQLCQKNF